LFEISILPQREVNETDIYTEVKHEKTFYSSMLNTDHQNCSNNKAYSLGPGLNPPVGNCFATDRSKAVTPRVHIVLIVCGVCFETDHFINHDFSHSLLLGCVGRLRLLNVAFPDMRISLFYVNSKNSQMLKSEHNVDRKLNSDQCRVDGWVGVISPRPLVLKVLFVDMRTCVLASFRLVHPRTWFKPPVANCFATDRSKAVNPNVLDFV
jgi:hypothetical protein